LLFDELEPSQGIERLRQQPVVACRHRDRLATLELVDDRPFLDIDTWDDYRQVTGSIT